MEVAVPPRNSSPDFNFSSASAYTSPHISAPSSPRRFGDHYFSAPSSPTRASAFYQEFNDYLRHSRNSSGSVIPYDWEEKPGTPKSKTTTPDDEEEETNGFEFEFDFSRDSDSASSVAAADDLFDGGKIKPLKPPPMGNSRLGYQPLTSPRSPIARIRQALSPKRRNEVDPFAVAMEQSRRSPVLVAESRGRERTAVSVSNSSRKASRSLSPYRYSSPAFQQQEPPQQQQQTKTTTTTKPTSTIPKSSSSSSSSASSSRRWSFRDFLLFRSASEGRASDRDPLRKFSLHSGNNKRTEDVKNSSFRSVESSSSNSGSMRRNRVSAHELHYKSNRAVAEEMKRKTVLPYKQGLFGWFRV